VQALAVQLIHTHVMHIVVYVFSHTVFLHVNVCIILYVLLILMLYRWGHGSLVWLDYATWLRNHSEGPDECRALLLRAIATVKAEDASAVVCTTEHISGYNTSRSSTAFAIL
jgi:hypothetical protein